MDSPRSPRPTLWRAATRCAGLLLFGHLSLRREGELYHVVLVDKPAEPDPAPAQDEAALMRGALKTTLDADPRSRRVFKHLRVVESALARDGVAGLTKLPLPLLGKASAQLEGLVSDWSAPGLAALRSHLTVRLMDAAAPDTGWKRTDAHLSDFRDARRVQVQEVSVSDFMRAAAEQAAGQAGQTPR